MRLAPLVLVALAPLAACLPDPVTAPPIVPAPKIRGGSQSLIASTSQRLFIVDGQVGTTDDLSTEDIEAIEVIKGPAAATLYGDTKCPPILIRVKRPIAAAPAKR